MVLNDRAAALAPYAKQLLYNPDVQASAREASQAARAAYRRARGKDAPAIAQDKKIRRQVDKAVAATGALLKEVRQPPPPRKSRRARRWAGLALVAVLVAAIASESTRARLAALVQRKEDSVG
jgi:hypothetical protein